jgi:zinc protease
MKKTSAALGLLAVLAGGGTLAAQDRLRRPPPFEPLAPLKLPELQTYEIANGLKLGVVFREKAPIVSLHLILGGGESASPEKGGGLATLVATLFGTATLARRPSQVEEAVEDMGGNLAVWADADNLRLSFHFLDESLDDALGLVGEMILQPNYTERALVGAKRTVTYDLLEKERNPEFAARRHLFRLLFEGHPYGRFAFSRDLVRNLTLKDLLEYVGRTVRPNNAHLLLVGNLDINTAVRKVSHYLNTWPRRELPPAPLPPLRPPARDRIVFLDVPQASECAICAGTVLPALSPADGSALAVLSQILGGTIFARLSMNLRESKGYARYAYSEVLPLRAGGVFLVRAAVRPNDIVPAAEEILKEVRKLAKEPPFPEEVAQAKGYLMANFPVAIERYDLFSERIAEAIALGGVEDRWSRYYEAVIGVDVERTSALGQPFCVVIAGAKAACLDRLAEFETVEIFEAKGQYLSTLTKRKEP